MGIWQEGTPLSPLSGDDDCYLVSGPKRLEIQQLWVCFTIHTFKLVSLLGNIALKKRLDLNREKCETYINEQQK